MMTVDEFKSLCASLEIDESLQIDSSMRLGPTVVSTGPTRAMTGNPFVATRPVHDLELHETIGEGGMGLVRSATQHALRRQVAVKTLKPDVETGEATNTLLHEALVTGRLEHPNVVPIYTLGETEHGAPIIVMKRITGVSWLQCIQNPQAAPDFRPDDPLGWHLDIFEEVCLATHFAHSREIIHRDIKPENVMVGAFGEVYLLDWGVAVTVEEDKSGPLLHVTEATGICGTPMYMAPEMAAGESHRIGPRSDVYLLGATLYHVLTGDPPHQGRSAYQVLMSAYISEPPKFPDDIPDALVKICHKAMARDPDDRYQTADELRHALIDALQEAELRAKETDRIEATVCAAYGLHPVMVGLFSSAEMNGGLADSIEPAYRAAGMFDASALVHSGGDTLVVHDVANARLSWALP